MSVRLFSASIQGIDAQLVEVEVDSAPGLHAFHIVGLPDKAVEESRDRIAAALRNTGFATPSAQHKKIIVNLAPADVRKEGPAYDLPIAVGYLLETKQTGFDPEHRMFAGELSLDGSLKHTNGILATAILAKNNGLREIIVPAQNAAEAAVVKDISVIPARTIGDVVAHLDGTRKIAPHKFDGALLAPQEKTPDISSLSLVMGQETAKRALAIAAAGGHNMLMYGPPGSGKTILAKAFTELLPSLSLEEAIEVAKVYSAVGLLNGQPLSFKRPFRSPHHTTSPPAVIGGGTWPKPGEISLAHRGVLFLDELPEFPRNVLESLRQPLEDGTVTVARASGSASLPAKFTLIAAMNPCPCGNYGDAKASCICLPIKVLQYRKKLSGPLLDRIDIQVNVPRETLNTKTTQNIEEVLSLQRQIRKARAIQTQRLTSLGMLTNSEITYKNIDQLCLMEPAAEQMLQQAVNAKSLSLRSYHKIRKLARTIADMEEKELIGSNHLAQAIALRVNEKMLSGLV